MDSIAISGVGLIGGSFGLALREAGFGGEIVGVSSSTTIEKAVARGIVTRGVSIDEAARRDLLFLAQPVSGIIATLKSLSASGAAPALVTDAGSTKQAIVEAAQGLPLFVGGHPMAGKELRGVEAAEAHLFRGRAWLMTSEPPPALRYWIEAIGATITVLTPLEHDRLVALVSHAPQLISNAIAAATRDKRSFGGPGLESMTRLSRSSYDIWSDILSTNPKEVVAALDGILDEISRLRDGVANGDTEVLKASFPADSP